MDWTDIVRLINVGLALTALSWLLIDLSGRAKNLTVRRLYLTMALAGFLLAVVVGSLEQMAQNVVPGYRMAFTATACIWTIIALHLGRHDDQDSIQEIKAEVWLEGAKAGQSRAMRHMSDEPNLSLAMENNNPYRLYTPLKGDD